MRSFGPKSHRVVIRLFVTLIASIALCAGCMTVDLYQPLAKGFQDHVAEIDQRHFTGTRIVVHCLQDANFSEDDAQALCRHLTHLLDGQGSETRSQIIARRGQVVNDEGDFDLMVEVRSRTLVSSSETWLAPLSWFTLTLVPVRSEQAFRIELSVTDKRGNLMHEDAIESRFVSYEGAGFYLVHTAIQWIAYPNNEKVRQTPDTTRARFSNDLYAFVTQGLLNARNRMRVLHESGKTAANSSDVF